jgi:glycosyltransferase involved in cell wall biosynthesis
MEWIIVDDGTDKINDLIASAKIPQIKYFSLDTKMALGAKRNYMHQHARGSIIVYMDDDDYYPPERVAHAVDRLTEHKDALCAGSSEIYIYFKHIRKLYQAGPYGPNHATAGTFAFRRELLNDTRYEDHAALAEEKAFLKDYTVPFVQLDPLKSILVFSHEHNTFDKRKLLENPNPLLKVSDKTIDMFIRKPNEAAIKNFFMNEIDGLLENYEPGHPRMKPDVLVQMKKMTEEREQAARQQAANGQQQIVMERPGQEPVALTTEQVVGIVQQQQQQIQQLQQQIQQMQQVIQQRETQVEQQQQVIQHLISKNPIV